MSEEKKSSNVVPLKYPNKYSYGDDEHKNKEKEDPTMTGGGNDGDGSSVDMKDYVDAKIAEDRARTDARFTEVLSAIDGLSARMTSKATTISWTVGTGVSIAGLIIAMLAYGGDRFDGGVQMSIDKVDAFVELRRAAESNAEQIDKLIEQTNRKDSQIEALLDALARQSKSGQQDDNQQP